MTRIASIQLWPVSVAYTHRESSSQVNRDGVTDVIVKLTTTDGLVGWGESCSGADTASVVATLESAKAFVVGRDIWHREAMRDDFMRRGVWNFREPTANFAWAGIDMALWDLCGKQTGRSVCDLLGGPRRTSVDYFCYLPSALEGIERAARDGLAAGYSVFYLKTGLEWERDAEAVRLLRSTVGAEPKIRIDCNEAWTVGEAVKRLAYLDRFNIDFAEQPVPADPIENMVDLRSRCSVQLAANEGLWREVDAYTVIKRRAADVLCFSSYWVGSLGAFHRLGSIAALEGMSVCKHTHGELAIAASAGQQVLLALPRIVDGNQSTAPLMTGDVVAEPLEIASGPTWRASNAPGLGVDVDEDRVAEHHDTYLRDGQFLPYQRESLASEDPAWHTR